MSNYNKTSFEFQDNPFGHLNLDYRVKIGGNLYCL